MILLMTSLAQDYPFISEDSNWGPIIISTSVRAQFYPSSAVVTPRLFRCLRGRSENHFSRLNSQTILRLHGHSTLGPLQKTDFLGVCVYGLCQAVKEALSNQPKFHKSCH